MQSNSPNSAVKWAVEHLDHFCISVVVSIAVTVAAHSVTAHMGAILHFLHVPEHVVRWMGY